MRKRVLQCVTGNFDVGGLSQIVFRWGQVLRNEDIIFDYLCRKYYPENQYTEQIAESGGMLSFPDNNLSGIRNQLDYFNREKKLIQEQGYQYVHINADTAYNMVRGALIPRLLGVDKVILHSHSAGVDRHSFVKYAVRMILHHLLKPAVPLLGTDYLACSEKAADWMFPKRVKESVGIINNSIDVEKYGYDEEKRDSFRKLQHIGANKVVVGNVGRFVYQKNHAFLLKIAETAKEDYSDLLFVMIGDGELFDSITSQAKEKKLTNIIFTGKSDEVDKWMQAFDVFILPSHYEGLPVAAIEAQSAGLPCICSDQIDRYTKIADDVVFLPIEDPKKWCEEILCWKKADRVRNYNAVMDSDFNITKGMKTLEEIYLE